MRKNHYTYLSHTTRTRGGAGFNLEDRDDGALERMGLESPTAAHAEGEKSFDGARFFDTTRLRKGQRLDIGRLSVVSRCACCGEEKSTNIVGLCGECGGGGWDKGIGKGVMVDEVAMKVAHIAHRYRNGEISLDEALELVQE